MKFRTEYKAERSDVVLNPEREVMLLGSCFADNITKRMVRCRWDAVNPFGVLFNPLSIAEAVNLALLPENEAQQTAEASLFECDGIWHSWLFDSGVSARDKSVSETRIAEALNLFRSRIVKSEAIFVTFGTAWCYFLNATGDVAANCHKQPQSLFTRRRIGIEEIVSAWKTLIEKLHTLNPTLQVIFTVSPVRHLKDGFVENMRSKATLLLAVEELCKRFEFCRYFPAYEIVNDDLRDYRFYAADLAHPSEQAVDYIWEIFQETYLDAAGRQRLKEGEKLTRRAEHRPIIV